MACLSLVSFMMLAMLPSCSAWGSPGPSPPPIKISTCCTPAMEEFVKNYRKGDFSFAIGGYEGPCCILDTAAGGTTSFLGGGETLNANTKMPVWSSSKWVTGFVILRLIDAGKFTLDTRVAELLDFWTNDPHDSRSSVTVRHLLAQIDGMKKWDLGGLVHTRIPGMCPSSAGSTMSCAKDAHDNLFVSPPGESWRYSDSSFYVLGAIAMKVTGHYDYNAVFQEYLAMPLNMKNAEFSGQVLTMITGEEDPGANLEISLIDYSQFLRKIFSRTLVSAELHREAERIHTLDVLYGVFVDGYEVPMPMPYGEGVEAHYNLASWNIRETTGTGADEEAVHISCGGAQGFYPYVWRNGCESHWGIMAREGSYLTGPLDSQDAMKTLLPLAKEAMLKMPCTTTTTTTPIDPSMLSGAYARFYVGAVQASLIAFASILNIS